MQPVPQSATQPRQIGAQRVVAGDDRDGPLSARGGHPEAVVAPLDDERRRHDGVEFGQPAGAGTVGARRGKQREGEADEPGGTGCRRGPAGNASPGGATTAQRREAGELTRGETAHDRDPRLVEVRGRGRAAPPGDVVGLLDERDREPVGEPHLPGGLEVDGADTPARPVPEHEHLSLAGRAGPRLGQAEVRPCLPSRGVDEEGLSDDDRS
jgi:hypothetical protein